MKQIVFTRLNTAELLDAEIAAPAEDQVVVKTMVSTVSCGTERANITGSTSVSPGRPPEEVPHFPRYPGYSSSGVVVAKGGRVRSVEVGDRVVAFHGDHCAFNTLPEDSIVRIEDDRVSFAEAAVYFIASFALAGVRKTRLEVGEPAMVMGLGLLGQLAVQFARAAGAAPLVAADPVPGRREAALRLGADYALDPFMEGFADEVKRLTGGGAAAAVEVTGSGAGLDETLDCMARFGRVALLGCTRSADFPIDYYRKVHFPGITLVGAHTNARPSVESHPGWYTHRDDIRCIMKLCLLGRIDLKGMIAETHSPADCQAVYTRLIGDRNFPAVVQFDWTRLEPPAEYPGA